MRCDFRHISNSGWMSDKQGRCWGFRWGARMMQTFGLWGLRQGCIGRGAAAPPPPPLLPGRPAASPWRQVPASMAFVTDRNRPQPLRQPPPSVCLTASGAASEVPSLLMHPWPAGVCRLAPVHRCSAANLFTVHPTPPAGGAGGGAKPRGQKQADLIFAFGTGHK